MVQNRNQPTPSQWAAIKNDFHTLYLDKNMTLPECSEWLVKHRGFTASERQYKIKVKQWEIDCKKIKGPVWHSMFIVMKHRNARGLSSVFKVPIRVNHFEIIKADRITKQINRDRTVFDSNNLQRAEEILKEAGVELSSLEEEKTMMRNSSMHGPEASQVLSQNSSLHWQTPAIFEDSKSCGSGVPRSIIQPAPIPPNSTAVVETSNSFRSVTQSLASGSGGPSPISQHSDFIVDARTLSPETATAVTSIATEGRIYTSESLISGSFFFSDPSCTTQKHAEFAPEKQSARVCDEQQRAILWVRPYVQLCARREPISAAWFQGSRAAAQSAFNDMLASDNKHTFPYCNWVITVLASNEQTALLTVFLEDCCEVIDALGDKLQGTYGAAFHLLLALYTKEEEVAGCHAKFESSLKLIGIIWGRSDPNYLVMHCHWMWLMLERKEHQEALASFREYIPIVELTMGKQHVVTLNYLTVYARALAETGSTREAILILEDVSRRIDSCNDLLRPYRYRQIMRLAELQIEVFDYVSAEANLMETTQFRTHHFGMNTSCTWMTIQKHCDFLKMQNRLSEADLLWQQSLQRRQQENANR